MHFGFRYPNRFTISSIDVHFTGCNLVNCRVMELEESVEIARVHILVVQ